MERIYSHDRINAYLTQYDILRCFSSCDPVFVLHHYFPGELLASPFEETRYLQFIVEGELSLYQMPTEDRFSMVQSPYYSARMIGEVELFDNEFQTFFAEARTDVYTLALSYRDYREKLLDDKTFLLTVCRSLSDKLKNAVTAASQLPLKEQVINYLSAAAPGTAIRDIAHFSQMLHVSTRQLLRVLSDLCEEGWLIRPKKGTYLVTDKAPPQ